MTKEGYYHLCLWVYPKDRSCSMTPGDRKKFFSVGHSYIFNKDWHCSHYFNHIDQPLHVCQCGGKRSPHFKAPQYNHRNHRKPKEMTQRLDRVYLEDRITVVYWEWWLYNKYGECVCPCHKVQTTVNLTTFWCSYKQSEYRNTCKLASSDRPCNS